MALSRILLSRGFRLLADARAAGKHTILFRVKSDDGTKFASPFLSATPRRPFSALKDGSRSQNGGCALTLSGKAISAAMADCRLGSRQGRRRQLRQVSLRIGQVQAERPPGRILRPPQRFNASQQTCDKKITPKEIAAVRSVVCC